MIMHPERVWKTLLAAAALLAVGGLSDAQPAPADDDAPLVEYRENKTDFQNNGTIGVLQLLSNDGGTMSRPLFGDLVADSMRHYSPFSNVNKNCSRDGRQFEKSLNDHSLWAVQMYDSSSKYPRGSLRRDEVTDLGHYDQCTSVSSRRFGIRGAHAVAIVRFRFTDDDDNDDDSATRNQSAPPVFGTQEDSPLPRSAGPETLLWALCVPDSCTNEDVQSSVEHVLTPVFRNFSAVVDVAVPPSLYTSKNSTLEYTGWAPLIYGILFIVFVLMIAGTAYDVFTVRSKPESIGVWGTCLYSFSMASNTKDLMSDMRNREFAVTNGLRTMGIISVIVGHRVALDSGSLPFNPEHTERILTNFWLSILKSPIVVEIFFVISGFFTNVVITDRLDSGKPLQFGNLLLSRLVRIFPSYIAVLLIFAFIVPYAGDGPFWKLIAYPEAEFCRKNWWTNLLFINNYVNTKEMCMLHSWYLACDMHFFIIGTFLCYVLWKWKKAGVGVFFCLFAVSIYLPAKYVYENKQWGVMPFFHSNMKNIRLAEHFQKVYIKSHHRITTYLVGFAAAYVYQRLKRSTYKFSVTSRTIGFTSMFLLHWACYFSTNYFYLPGRKYDPWDHVLYFTVQKIAYSITIAYTIVVGSLSNFGAISSLLECKLFSVVARLSYIMYLSSFIVQLQSVGQIRQPLFGSFWTLYWEINADVLTAVSYSLVINLMAEAPVRKMFNRLTNDSARGGRDKSEADVCGRNNGLQTGENLSRFKETI